MVHYLVGTEIAVGYISSLECPEEVEARRFSFFIVDPTAVLKGPLDVTVATFDDEDLLAGFDFVLLFPFLHVCDVQIDSLEHSLVALKEPIEGLAVDGGLWLGRRWACHDNLIIIFVLFIAPLLHSAILILSKRGQIFDLLGSLLNLFSCNLMDTLLAIKLGLLHLLFLFYFLLYGSQLFFLSLADRLRSGLLVGGLLKNGLLALLVEFQSLLGGEARPSPDDGGLGARHFRRQCAAPGKVLSCLVCGWHRNCPFLLRVALA